MRWEVVYFFFLYIYYYVGVIDFLGLNFYMFSIVYLKDDWIDISYDVDKGIVVKLDFIWIGYKFSINCSVFVVKY